MPVEWDAVGAIGEVLGAIVVIATVGYLAVQVRQNTAMLQSTSRQALVDNDRVSIVTALDNVDLMEKLANGESLSARDQFRYSALWLVDLRNREMEFFQSKAGVLDETAWASYQQTLLYSLGTERDRQWWAKVGRNSFDPDFVEMVDEFVGSHPTNNLLKDMFNWEGGTEHRN